MTVYHPRRLELTRAGLPGGVTVHGTTYSVGEDGAVDCPGDLEPEIADRLADAYDVDVDDILESEASAEPTETPEVTPDNIRYEGDPDILEEHTKEELLEWARERDIAGRSSMDKDELIDALSED